MDLKQSVIRQCTSLEFSASLNLCRIPRSMYTGVHAATRQIRTTVPDSRASRVCKNKERFPYPVRSIRVRWIMHRLSLSRLKEEDKQLSLACFFVSFCIAPRVTEERQKSWKILKVSCKIDPTHIFRYSSRSGDCSGKQQENT